MDSSSKLMDMDRKITAVLIVTILVIAGVGGAYLAASDDGKPKRMNTDEVAAVYGNANGDYTVDSLDAAFIQDIVDGKSTWDREANPFADADNNGVITQADVDLVNKIIGRESCDVYYYNGFGEPQRMKFHVDASRIAVTYWQESEAMGVLGLWDNVKLVNPSDRNNTKLYDFTGKTFIGNSDTGALDSEQVQQILQGGITLIVSSASASIRIYAEPLVEHGVQTIYLRGAGDACLGTLLTMGVLLDAEERAQRFVQYWVDLQEMLDERVPNISDRPSVAVVMVHGYNEDRFIGSYGGIFTSVNNPSGEWQIISKLANVYTTDAVGNKNQGRNYYGIDWFIQNQFDYLVVMGSGVGAKMQDDYNVWFETISEKYFANTQEYKVGNIIGTTYSFGGYSAYTLMPILAWMLYPDHFTYQETLDMRQQYYDEFVPLHPDCTTLPMYYLGSGFDASYLRRFRNLSSKPITNFEPGSRMDPISDMEPIERAVGRWAHRDEAARDEAKASSDMRIYSRYILRKWIFIAACIVVVVAAGYSMAIGNYAMSVSRCYEVLWNHLTGNIDDATEDYVIWSLRAPRVFLGIVAGVALGASGAVMQSILRNPLADPYTTGISSGASFGATLALGLGLTLVSNSYAVIVNAFIFSLIPMVVIIAVAQMKSTSPVSMMMAGVAVMYIFNACSTIVKLWSTDETLASIFAWSVGSIDTNTWDGLQFMAPTVTIGFVILLLTSRRLNVMSTGDESSRSIGVNANSLRIFCLLVVSMITATTVCFTGLIGFIGLVCPHIARMVIGSDNRYLIPASAVFGAALLLVADSIGRVIIAPSVIQVGVITAFIGAPLFLYLIVKQKRELW